MSMSVAPEERAYDDTHRAFLQAYMSRSTMTFAEAKPILSAILTADNKERETLVEDVDRAMFERYNEILNDAISALDLEIRCTRSQENNGHVWALINTTSDPMTQIATTHSAEEIAFVKRLLDAMFETNNTREREIMAITKMQGSALARPSRRSEVGTTPQTQGSTGKGLTISEAEKVMESMVDEGWFIESERGYLSLSPRALMELRTWLVDTYNVTEEDESGETIVEERIKSCNGCREIITVGQRCSNYDCNVRYHNFKCIMTLGNDETRRKCPECRSDWTGKDFVGEKASGKKVPAGRRGPGSTQRRRQQEEEDGEEEEEESS